MTRERLTLWLLLAATFAIRAIHPDQPIVENYVGRQIPTAMVARNLERGSGFLHPQLDTGPFPNLFLVEPPIYAQVVASFRPIFGFELEPTGRLVSAAATTLAAWGLFGLVRRREGLLVAFLALGSFCVFPVMIRYGRAFQPDALMLGCVLAGLRGWDEYEDRGDWRWAAFGGFVLSIGLALKLTVAWSLIGFVLIVRRWPMGLRLTMAASMLVPAFAWYLYAWNEVARPGGGSLASSDNASLWLRSFSPAAWLRLGTYATLGRGLAIQSFTPIGFVLAGLGLVACGKLDRLWVGWGLGCVLAVLCLASKWHHTYYWMVVAPLVALGMARGMMRVYRVGKLGVPIAGLLGSFFLALCMYQSISTWRTPREWSGLLEAARELADRAPTAEELVVAPEAVLYYAGLRGYRLEIDPAAMTRAAGEWAAEPLAPRELHRGWIETETSWEIGIGPLALVDFYNDLHGLKELHRSGRAGSLVSLLRWRRNDYPGRLLIAEVGAVDDEPRRRAWRKAMRERQGSKILVDKPELMIAEWR